MVKGFRTYSSTVFVLTSPPLPFVPASLLSAPTPLIQKCHFSMPKTWHCEHTPNCASADACRAKRCRQKKAAGQHEAEAQAAEQAPKNKKEAHTFPTDAPFSNAVDQFLQVKDIDSGSSLTSVASSTSTSLGCGCPCCSVLGLPPPPSLFAPLPHLCMTNGKGD